MIVTMIIVCEVGFWVLLVGGLSARYPLKMPRTGAAVLMCEPLLELLLLIVTAIDLKNGATADHKHGLAAVYIGFSLAYGRYLVNWADQRFAHRFAGGPKPVKPPKYGMARAKHEWKQSARTVLMAAIAVVLLQIAIWYVGAPERTEALVGWQAKMGLVSAIVLVIAVSYTVWPRPERGSGRDSWVDKPAASAAERIAEARKRIGL
ncbi:hypothetical protein [Streptomyces sp. H27-D2]|uniref:hypothetical protein n=1 Tax=Streptomyces sp. H27-D2 TaxID=3046304 RepID=UPI002DBB2A3E|nr:hypothetical protein [Streptomyces sp. H27-D2]MEC4016716.1 hypothetical protein [Streptomyces sp. H27-D2]